ncbi:hypothetical protein X797_003295 [Metarhizium robertsii]|uniref:Uncharacterized protein n=1 Tax=Metarhizium robertsii TaxID=568076 RepID=A0A0A1V108_9HYPO|nr:hypothetical protein X797_003295 [Metarhizium robertsii]
MSTMHDDAWCSTLLWAVCKMHRPPSPSSLVAQKEAAHEAACHPGRALDGSHGIFYRVFYSVHGEEVVWTEYSSMMRVWGRPAGPGVSQATALRIDFDLDADADTGADAVPRSDKQQLLQQGSTMTQD